MISLASMPGFKSLETSVVSRLFEFSICKYERESSCQSVNY